MHVRIYREGVSGEGRGGGTGTRTLRPLRRTHILLVFEKCILIVIYSKWYTYTYANLDGVSLLVSLDSPYSLNVHRSRPPSPSRDKWNHLSEPPTHPTHRNKNNGSVNAVSLLELLSVLSKSINSSWQFSLFLSRFIMYACQCWFKFDHKFLVIY